MSRIWTTMEHLSPVLAITRNGALVKVSTMLETFKHMHALQALLRAFLLWLVSWLVSFKLIAIIINQGPLVSERRLGHFFLKLLLPVLPIDAASNHLKIAPKREIPWQSAAKFLSALTVSALLQPLMYSFIVSKAWQPPLIVTLLIECATLRQWDLFPVTSDDFADISGTSPNCILLCVYKYHFESISPRYFYFYFEKTSNACDMSIKFLSFHSTILVRGQGYKLLSDNASRFPMYAWSHVASSEDFFKIILNIFWILWSR